MKQEIQVVTATGSLGAILLQEAFTDPILAGNFADKFNVRMRIASRHGEEARNFNTTVSILMIDINPCLSKNKS